MRVLPSTRHFRKAFCLLSAVVCAFLLVPRCVCLAREWYVAPDAPDGAEGKLEKPAALHSALDRAGAGDTVFLRGGRYELTRQVFLEKVGLTLRNHTDEKPVLSMTTRDRKLQAAVWLEAKGTGIFGLEVVGGGTYCVKIDFPDCLVSSCRIHGPGRDCIKITPSADNCRIENCEIYQSGRTGPSNAEGIDNVAADGCVIRNCYIHDITTNGLYMKGGAANCLIENNVVTDCAHNGIMLGQSTDVQYIRRPPHECVDSVARRNFVARVDGAGLSCEAALRCRFEDNTVYDVARVRHGGVSVQENEHHTPSKDVTFTNNIIVVLSGAPMVVVHPNGLLAMSDMTCDGNVYFNPARRYSFSWEPDRKVFSSLAEWRSATPFDAASAVVAAPPEGLSPEPRK